MSLFSSELLLPPREAGARLGVAPSTLRRLATVYVEVYGPDALPWSDGGKGGGGRLWTGESLQRTRAARELVESGRASSFELALRTLKDAPVGLELHDSAPPGDSAAVAELRGEVEALRAELAEMRDEIAQLRALPPAAEPERSPERIQTVEQDSGAAEVPAKGSAAADGPIVRVARWLEQRVRRGQGER